MNFKNDLPIYMQIMDIIKIQIVNGEFKPGEKLLSVREEASQLKVNPNTVQRAYQELENEGLVETRRGMGTFIKDEENLISDLRKDLAKKTVSEFIFAIKQLGLSREEIMSLIEDELNRG